MSIQTLSRQQVQSTKPLIEGKKFDTIFCLSVLWLLGGTFTDAWAHNNIPRLETFWTPWHAILYSGLLFLIASVMTVLVINRRRCNSWLQAIPQGYKLAYLALGLMVLDGLGDMTWHLLFGVEQNLDALFSPTHLTGLVCIGLFATAPLYSMYIRKVTPSSFSDYFLLATAFLLPYVLIVNTSQPFSVFAETWPTTTPLTFSTGQLAGIGSYLLCVACNTILDIEARHVYLHTGCCCHLSIRYEPDVVYHSCFYSWWSDHRRCLLVLETFLNTHSTNAYLLCYCCWCSLCRIYDLGFQYNARRVDNAYAHR